MNNSNVGRLFVSPQLVSAKPVGIWQALAVALLLVAALAAHGQTEQVLYSFANTPDGANPRYVTPVLDAKGNLYGTTNFGGAHGLGAVFERTPSGTEKVLWSFGNGTDGAYPLARLVIYRGNLYGTTVDGGTFGGGTVFEVTLSGKESILHNFANNDIDGFHPYAGLTLYLGNFYGTTSSGGGIGSAAGTVFEMAPSGTPYSILHTFGGNPDGAFPYGGVVFDKSGNRYGTTFDGGSNGFGTLFMMAP